jgi:hypothetical protein
MRIDIRLSSYILPRNKLRAFPSLLLSTVKVYGQAQTPSLSRRLSGIIFGKRPQQPGCDSESIDGGLPRLEQGLDPPGRLPTSGD